VRAQFVKLAEAVGHGKAGETVERTAGA
jgi:hypothetical protein